MKKPIILTAAIVGTFCSLALIGQVSAFPPIAAPNQCELEHYPVNSKGLLIAGRIEQILRMMELLGLSQAQREEIWGVLDENRPSMRTHMAALFAKRQQLRELINHEFDELKLVQLANAQGQNITKLIVLRGQTFSQIRLLLTPEQQSKLADEIVKF
jgi:Spy/CpxP family protein refolding chaperone